MKKIMIVLLPLLIGFAGLRAQSVAVTFRAPGLKIQQVYLQAGNERVELPYDSLRPMKFALQDFTVGYAWLEFGQARKMIYLERGKELQLEYKRVPGSQASPYCFTGDLAPENRWLNEYERILPVRLNQEMTSAEVIRLLKNEADLKKKEVNAQDFSAAFTALESQRQAFAVYGSFRNFRNWDHRLYSFLNEQIREEPALLPCDAYRSFLLDALNALAGEGRKGYDPYEYTDFQLNYMDGQLKDESVKGFLAASVITAYMERRGADRIEQLMDIGRHLLYTPEEKERVGETYRKWKAMAKGTPAGEYIFRDLDGKAVALSDFRGRYVFIDCWATWCGPCRKELQPLRKLEHDYAGKNIVFLSISGDEKMDKWKKYVTDQKLEGIQLIDPPGSEFNRRFAISAIPRFILIDPEGKVYDAIAPRPSEPACRLLLDGLPRM